MRPTRALLPFAALALLAGCVSARATMLVPGQFSPVPESEVRVFLAENEVPSTCQRIALIHTSGDVDMTDETQMITAARRRAGQVGANAVLLSNVREPGSGRRVAAAVFGVSADRKGQLIGYRCPDAAPAPAAATTPR